MWMLKTYGKRLRCWDICVFPQTPLDIWEERASGDKVVYCIVALHVLNCLPVSIVSNWISYYGWNYSRLGMKWQSCRDDYQLPGYP